jgi:hypothetical protein
MSAYFEFHAAESVLIIENDSADMVLVANIARSIAVEMVHVYDAVLPNDLNTQLTIPTNAQAEIRVRYQDNNYSDNGYYAPDPGQQNQCVNTTEADVSFNIESQGEHGFQAKLPRGVTAYYFNLM